MLPNNIVKKVPGETAISAQSKQGYISDLSKLTVPALVEILDRQNKLLANSVDELKMILHEGTKFDDVMKDILDCKDMETDKEVLIASNKSLAEFNLTKESSLDGIKRDIIQLSQNGEHLYRQVEEKLSRINSNSSSNNLEDLLALLQSATATTEDESESLADAFLNGNTDVDSFLEQFISKRKLMHLRRVKSDKMKEMVQRRLSRIDSYPPQNIMDRSPGVHGHSMFYPTPNAVPYPTSPVSMPFPSVPKFNNY